MNEIETTILLTLAARADAATWNPFRRPTNDAACFAHDVIKTGLSIRCRNRPERLALDSLRVAGLVTVEGSTNAVKARLTTVGALAVWAGLFPGHAEPEQVLSLVQKIKRLSTRRCPWGRDITLGYQVTPWKKMGELSLLLVPAVLAGWVGVVYGAGTIWGATTTDEGRNAAVPEGLPDLVFNDAEWRLFERTGQAADKALPPDSGNKVASMLPASAWWDDNLSEKTDLACHDDGRKTNRPTGLNRKVDQ